MVVIALALAFGLSLPHTTVLQDTVDQTLHKQVEAAVALYRQGKLDDAIQQFEELHKTHARSPDVNSWLGFLYLRDNKAEQAVPFLLEAETERPLDLEVEINLGNAYMALRDNEKALDKYKTAMHLSKTMFEPYYNSGTIYLQEHEYTKAVQQFTTALRLKPTDAFVVNNLGVAYEDLHDLQHAAQAFRKAADMLPTNQTFAHNAGLALAKLHSPDALPYLVKALGDGKDPAVALALGDAYSRAGRKADALKYYEGLRTAEAGNATFWFNLGVLRAQNGDENGGEQAYRRALQLNPNDLDTLNNLGLMLYRNKEYQESTTLFDKLSGLDPGSVAAKVNLGASASKSGDLKKAIDAWREVLKAEPKRVGVRLDLANALWDLGHVDDSRQQYLAVLNIEKNNGEALNGIGLCYLKASKYAQAEAAFRSSIEAEPNLIGAYNNLAVTLQRSNHLADAIKILEKAEQIAPDDEDIKRNLAKMRGEE